MSKKSNAAAALAAAPTRNEKIRATLTRTDFPRGEASEEDGLIHRSGRSQAVKKVHAICDSYSAKGKSRKDILARCAKLGIAEYTARTQYQRWRNPTAPKAKKVAKA